MGRSIFRLGFSEMAGARLRIRFMARVIARCRVSARVWSRAMVGSRIVPRVMFTVIDRLKVKQCLEVGEGSG